MTEVINGPVYADVPKPAFRPGPAGTHITIRGLTKYFAGWPLYENFDLDIPKHKIISVFGPNGCGKSTLINMISGLVPIDAGEILFDGKSLKDTKIGYVFQNYREALFPWMRTIDNIAYPLKLERRSKAEVDRRVEEALPVRTVGRPAADRLDHARAGARTRGAVPRRAVLRARLRDVAVHPREAAGGLHADRHHHDAGLA
jgi:ABC-type Fe3+/spermidine/putrescine transport system ATPase subunit